jgi:GNAT superfamily N-acetyltransferase
MTTTTIAASPEEHLENGYGAATPTGDNLLLDFARGEAEAFGVIVDALGGRVEHDARYGVHLRDSGRPTPFANAVLLSRPIADGEVDGLVGRLRAFFGGAPGGPYMLFSPFPLADLSPHGFAPVGHPPLMLRAPGGSAPLADGLHIVTAHDASTLADFEQTLIEAYPIPEMQPWQHADFLRTATLDSSWRFFVGYEGDRAVATAAAYVTPTVNIVELVSARPECRGKGYGAALTAAATLTEPDRPAMLIASDLGRNVYARLGYTSILRYTLWLGLR